MKIYVASKLENIEAVREFVRLLRAEGHEITYDWSVHGPMWRHGKEAVREVSKREMDGVADCEVLIALLPGGRGTHAEIGGALALDKKVILHSKTLEAHFGIHEDACAFYHHPNVVGYSRASLDDLAMNFERWLDTVAEKI